MDSVLVFCGSALGRDPAYVTAANDFGTQLARRGLTVVYGGGGVGLMGALADGALAAGGEVIGVIPRLLVDREAAHTEVSDLRVVETMHERKALMASLADAVVALPGGTGTLDELFEIVTWAQLGLHAKPIGLLEVGGYWAPLLAFLDHAVREGFVRPGIHDRLLREDSAPALLDLIGARAGAGAAYAVPNTRSPASPRPGRM